ncbi:hypothetical protein [Arthrobacter sp.]|uniref:HAAS signaling domain-containing protein n=1 Tax=Arthrobacter sp. TaxID=1667 RepID=UPI0026E064D4|nr:hypothetical protein [Arthrobacter sp.]MDO5753960.1 hypothetical protein [Arthrobacter sp.]
MTTVHNGGTRKLGLRHAMGRDWYVFKVDLHLDGVIPGRHRRRILADLRDSIDADAANYELPKVLAGLGKPRVVAASYAEGADQLRPLWSAGFMAAMIMLAIYWVLLFTYSAGMLAVVVQAGGEFTSHFFFVKVMAFETGEGLGIGWSGAAALWFPLALAAVAFIPASRGWRVFHRRA